MSYSHVIPNRGVVPTRVKLENGESVQFSSLPISEQEDTRRHVDLRNRIITYMNHHIDTRKELTQRLLIVIDLDPEMVRKLEMSLQLPETGDHNQLFQNYQEKYYSRRCLSYHKDNLGFCTMGACIANDVVVLDQVAKHKPGFAIFQRSLKVAASQGSFTILTRVLDVWKRTHCPDLSSKLVLLYGKCLIKVIKHGNLDMVVYLAELSCDESRKKALDKAIKIDQNSIVQYLLTLVNPNISGLKKYIFSAISYWALGSLKVIINMLGENMDRELMVKMLSESAKSGSVEITDFFLTSYKYTFDDGDRALSSAVWFESTDVARLIFERIPGVDPDICLYRAARAASLSIVKLAIDYGATNFVEAAKAAENEGYTKIYAYLRKAGLLDITKDSNQ